jgi:hypothetical protein
MTPDPSFSALAPLLVLLLLLCFAEPEDEDSEFPFFPPNSFASRDLISFYISVNIYFDIEILEIFSLYSEKS